MRFRQAGSGPPPRRLERGGHVDLYDLDGGRTMTPAELVEDLRAGRGFEVRRRGSGEDCTLEVLSEVLVVAFPGNLPAALSGVVPLSSALESIGPAAHLLRERGGTAREERDGED